MDRAQEPDAPKTTGEVIDFDDALLEACPADLRAQLMAEASLLAEAFAPEGRGEQLAAMADQMASGVRDADMDRGRARQLAAAMRRLAKDAQP
ncbi:MAG: hypothetical protein ABW360_13445 [Phenylobacterium sp.]